MSLITRITEAFQAVGGDIRALILDTNKKLVFSDRAAFVTWAGSNTPVAGAMAHVAVPGQARLLKYTYDGTSTDMPEASLNGWRAVAPVYLEHYRIATTTKGDGSGADYTSQVQAAMDATEGELVFTGFVKITDKVVCPNKCSPVCHDGRAYGGFNVFSDFNMSATCVFQPGTGETASTVGDFGMWFQQPSSPANRAALTQYPPAINIGAPEGEDALFDVAAADIVTGRTYEIKTVGTTNFTTIGAANNNVGTTFVATGAGTGTGTVDTDVSTAPALARGFLKAIRIEQAWDGIIGVGNCGGYRMGIVEVGAFNRNVDLYGPLDFLHVDSVHVWPFGFAGNSALANIYYDGDTIGFRARHVDGLTVDKLSVFRSKVVMGEVGRTTILPMGIDVLNLDGDKAVLRLQGESTKIGECYSSKSAAAANASYQDVIASGGLHQIGSLKATSNADGVVLTSGTADLHVDDYEVRQVAADRRAAIAQGSSRLSIGIARPRSDLTRTGHMFVQQSGASLHIGGLAPTDSGQPAVAYVSFATDDELNYANCPNYDVASPAHAGRGTYIGRNLTQRSASVTRLRKIGTGEGPEIAMSLARGSAGSETAPADGDVVGDVVWSIWDGNGYNPGAYFRGLVSGTPADGVTPMKIQCLIEDTAGNIAVPWAARGDRFDVNVDMRHVSDAFDIYHNGVWYMRHRIADTDIKIGATNSTNGLFYPFTIDASTETLILGTDETTNVEVKSPVTLDMQGAATDAIQFRMAAFRPHFVLEDKSTGAVDWQISADNGDLSFLYGDASTDVKLANTAFEIIDAGSPEFRFHGPIELHEYGSEGGELRIKDASGNTDFYIDCDSSNNLRIRLSNGTGIYLTSGGNVVMNSLPTYADDAAAGTGGLTANMVYKTSTGELRIKT